MLLIYCESAGQWPVHTHTHTAVYVIHSCFSAWVTTVLVGSHMWVIVMGMIFGLKPE